MGNAQAIPRLRRPIVPVNRLLQHGDGLIPALLVDERHALGQPGKVRIGFKSNGPIKGFYRLLNAPHLRQRYPASVPGQVGLRLILARSREGLQRRCVIPALAMERWPPALPYGPKAVRTSSPALRVWAACRTETIRLPPKIPDTTDHSIPSTWRQNSANCGSTSSRSTIPRWVKNVVPMIVRHRSA